MDAVKAIGQLGCLVDDARRFAVHLEQELAELRRLIRIDLGIDRGVTWEERASVLPRLKAWADGEPL